MSRGLIGSISSSMPALAAWAAAQARLAMKLRRYVPTGRVGHLQIAGVPERHEPDLGELNYPYLFALIDSLGYTGVIGAEYRPRAATSAGLGWFQPYKKDR